MCRQRPHSTTRRDRPFLSVRFRRLLSFPASFIRTSGNRARNWIHGGVRREAAGSLGPWSASRRVASLLSRPATDVPSRAITRSSGSAHSSLLSALFGSAALVPAGRSLWLASFRSSSKPSLLLQPGCRAVSISAVQRPGLPISMLLQEASFQLPSDCWQLVSVNRSEGVPCGGLMRYSMRSHRCPWREEEPSSVTVP